MSRNSPEISTSKHEERFFQAQPFAKSVICGFLAGAATGVPVAPFEYLKVKAQAGTKESFSQTGKNMLRSIPPFAALFGVLCAMEFSVNDRIGAQYGKPAGWIASAGAGATLLTAADHLMFYTQKGIKPVQALQQLTRLAPTSIFTGWTPMLMREFLFVLSVTYVGPQLGKQLKSHFNVTDEKDAQDWKWNFIGRLISGFVATTLSQPFDTAARLMQDEVKERYFGATKKSSFHHPRFTDVLRNNSLKMLYRGAAPRLVLATGGGAAVGRAYEYIEGKLNPSSAPKLGA